MTARATWIFAALLTLALAAGIAAATLGPAPTIYALALAAFPLGVLAAGALLRRRGARASCEAWAARLLAGAAAGVTATLAYDGYRVGVRDILGIAFDPFRVQPVFGQILTGLPTTHPLTLVAGWGFHLWLGVLVGMVFAAVRPRGGALAGALFAVVLQLGRWAMYPNVFKAGLSDHEFLANGVFGQLFWGVVLGLALGALDRFVVRRARVVPPLPSRSVPRGAEPPAALRD